METLYIHTASVFPLNKYFMAFIFLFPSGFQQVMVFQCSLIGRRRLQASPHWLQWLRTDRFRV